MRHRQRFLMYFWVCFAIFIFYALSVQASSPKIRAAFWGIRPAEQAEKQLRLLKEHGLNAALVNDSGYTVKENIWREWGRIAGNYGIALFPIHSFAGTDEARVLKGKYRPYVDLHGKLFSSTPCPLDAEYWNVSIAERFHRLAPLSNIVPIAGVLFDTEMYGGDFSLYRNHCFCDVCWKEFIQQEPFFFSVKDPKIYTIEGKKRHEYLRKRRLLQQYADYQEAAVATILSRIEQQIHDINPALQLGFLGYRDNWFYHGLVRGLGTPVMPVLVFSESSYIRGYTQYVLQEQASIMTLRQIKTSAHSGESSTPIAQYIPGLWLGRFFPEDLPSQLSHLAMHASGYWLFTADSLWDDSPKPMPWYALLHREPQEYWNSIQKTNTELARSGDITEPVNNSFPPVYEASFYDQTQNRLITQPSLPHFLNEVLPELQKSRQHQGSETHPASEPVYRRTTLFHGLKYPRALGTIRITHIPLRSSSGLTTYMLFNKHGAVIQEGTLNNKNSSITLKLPSNMSDIFSLITKSGKDLTSVVFSGLSYVVEASSTFPLNTFNAAQTYTAYVAPGKNRLTLRAYCFSPQESALLSIQSPGGRIRQDTEIIKYTEIALPVVPSHNSYQHEQDTPPASSQLSFKLISEQAVPFSPISDTPSSPQIPHFWELTVSPFPGKLFEDVRMYLYNQEFPYLIAKNSLQR